MALVSLIAVYLALTVLPFFFVEIAGHRMTVDLSYPMHKDIMKWIDKKPFDIQFQNGTAQFGNATVWYQSDDLSQSTHTGTHLDAPVHFGKGKWTVSDIPLHRLVERPLFIVDVTDQAQAERDYSASVADLMRFEETSGTKISPESVVLLRTGWSRFWPNKLEYFGTETADPMQAHFPGLSADGARWLVEQRQVYGVGVDAPSIDCGKCGNHYGFPAHVTLSAGNVYVLENIDETIFQVPVTGATITVLPINIIGASGAPARIIAQYLHHHHDTNPASALKPVSAFLLFPILLLLIAFSSRWH
ncbi:hypothetical protein TYRP_008867 [Tyrophagus putrescentiae]|nr:hypothetical protein TYRP_008867 [Tyrophagus putrescentiae]